MGKRGGSRNHRADAIISRIDRAREGLGDGPSGSIYDEGQKKRLHECQVGEWVRQVLTGANNFGPMLRVIDPTSGILENRRGGQAKLPPRSQVVVQP
jgi:hypothetical protein